MNSQINPLFSTQPGTAPRMDIYVGIHKALRAMMLDTLHAVGRIDVRDPAEWEAGCARVLALAEICQSHLRHENDFIHPAMEARHPGASGRIAAEHAEHVAAIERLRGAVASVRAAACGATRAQAALALYRQLALFVGENFAHMHVEETHHNQVLWAHYSDDELRALEGAIVASLPPAENLCVLRWMAPAMTPDERAVLLAGVRDAVPSHVFDAVLETVRPHLREQDWDKLMHALEGVQAVAP